MPYDSHIDRSGPRPELLLGVDGGGTGCRARLRRADGTTLGEGRGGPANIRLGLTASWAAILEAVDGALAAARLDRAALPRIAAGLGLAGIMTAEDATRFCAGAPPFGRLRAASDAHTACLGAFGGQDGGIVIAGTGSAGYCIVGGRGRGIGGWGFEVSDEGSGAWIGRQSIRAALNAHDGLMEGSPFTTAVLDMLGGTPDRVVGWVTGARPAEYGRLAPLALSYARESDPVAATILARAGEAIGAIAARLVALGAPAVCLMGGLADPIRAFLPPGIPPRLVPARGDAMEGAILLAANARGDDR
ncbi:MAG: hypothetical protein RLY86_948 [Pseudomonadota bacterium]|jgi:glucosamine kinase